MQWEHSVHTHLWRAPLKKSDEGKGKENKAGAELKDRLFSSQPVVCLL